MKRKESLKIADEISAIQPKIIPNNANSKNQKLWDHLKTVDNQYQRRKIYEDFRRGKIQFNEN